MFDPFLHIDEYKEGSLTVEQLSLFEEALKNDEQLQIVVNNYAPAKKLSEGLIELETRQILENARKKKPQKETSGMRYLWPVIGVAALLGGFILLSNLFQQSAGAEELFVENFVVPTMSVANKGETQDSLLIVAQTLFNSKAYEKSLAIFRTIENTSETSFYKAINYQVLNKPDSALIHLKTIQPQTNDTYWYSALAFIQQGKLTEAKQTLQKISDDSIHYIKSRKLLKHI